MHAAMVREVTAFDMDVALREPFGISTGQQTRARNVLVRVRLNGGATGWGEAAPFEAFNGETQAQARRAIERAAQDLIGFDARAWRSVGARVPYSSARCAIETAVMDALARMYGIPLWVMLGGATSTLETDITITTGSAEAARSAAGRLSAEGFRMLKVKVGGVPVAADKQRLGGVVEAGGACSLVLDANGAMESVDAAVELVAHVRETGGKVALFEQPMPAGDHVGLREVARRAGVRVAADESAASVADVVALAQSGAVQVVNIKLMKSGVAQGLVMADVARAHGLGLMIGGMVESGLAISMSASCAAAAGDYEFVDLDTPAWMIDAPIGPGYTSAGPRMDLSGIRAGHGALPVGFDD